MWKCYIFYGAYYYPASEMTYIVSGGALNSTHSFISLLIPLPAAGFREPAMTGHGELFKKKIFQIMAASDDIDGNSKHQQSLSAELSCATQIITLLIRLWLSLCPADVAALEAAVTSVVNDATKQVDVVSSVLLENL